MHAFDRRMEALVSLLNPSCGIDDVVNKATGGFE
jgi:hypothetical protein